MYLKFYSLFCFVMKIGAQPLLQLIKKSATAEAAGTLMIQTSGRVLSKGYGSDTGLSVNVTERLSEFRRGRSKSLSEHVGKTRRVIIADIDRNMMYRVFCGEQ